MAQKLILPQKRTMMLCGYKNPKYAEHWGYPHYGIDLSSIQGGAGDDPTVYASGEGTVLAAGRDSRLGYGVAVLYPQVRNHRTGEACDVVARYLHLRSLACKAGDAVKAGDPLGVEGKEGTSDYHLHLEFDRDTKWPLYSPQVAGGTFWKKGVDSTVDPSALLHVGAGQELADPTYNPAWLNDGDFALPAAPNEAEELEALRTALAECRMHLGQLEAAVASAAQKLQQALALLREA